MSYTMQEIEKQTVDWEVTINAILEKAETWRERLSNYDDIYFTGCGTSYYIAITAAYLSQHVLGKPSKAVPASEIMLVPDSVALKKRKSLLIGVSRSGSTTETVEALRRFSEDGYGDSLSIACKEGAQTSGVSDYAIELPHVDEQSIVMTGSFTNLLIATQALTALLTPDKKYMDSLKDLPRSGQELLEASQELAYKIGNDKSIEQFIYLGLGAYYGLASEAVLKVKEMTQVPTEAYSTLEFRHGPISMVDDKTMAVLLQSQAGSQYQLEVLKDIKKLGGKTTLVTAEHIDQPYVDQILHLPPGYSDATRAVLYLPFVQLVAYHRAVSKGLDPDKPRNLTQVVNL